MCCFQPHRHLEACPRRNSAPECFNRKLTMLPELEIRTRRLPPMILSVANFQVWTSAQASHEFASRPTRRSRPGDQDNGMLTVERIRSITVAIVHSPWTRVDGGATWCCKDPSFSWCVLKVRTVLAKHIFSSWKNQTPDSRTGPASRSSSVQFR